MSGVLSKRPFDRFTPASYGEAEGAPVYHVAKLSLRERAGFRGALAAAGLRFPPDIEMFRVLREVLAELAPENAAELLAQVEAYQDLPDRPDAAPTDGAAETDEARQAREAATERRTAVINAYNGLVDLLRAHPAVSHLLGLRTLFLEMAPLLATATALRGWDGVATAFRRVGGVVPDDVLEELPEDDVRAIGARAMALFTVDKAQLGN